MGWAAPHIAKLQAGEVVRFRPRGDSMTPHIKSGELVTVEPVGDALKVDDIVLCKVHGHEYLHFVKAIGADGRFQIGNARGHINGWTSQVFGRVTRVEP